MRGSLLPLLLLPLLGCEFDVEATATEDVFTFEPADADVLFVVDDSNSMAEAQAAVSAAVGSLTSTFTDQGLIWRAAVVTTDVSAADGRGRFLPIGPAGQAWTEDVGQLAAGLLVGVEGSNLERGLEAAWYGLTPPLATHDNAGFRREGARLSVLVISDEDDCSDEGALVGVEPSVCTTDPASLVPVDDYLARFRRLVPERSDFGLWALVETGVTPEFEGCGGTTPGSRYIAAARATAGEVAPLCGDVGATLTDFGVQMRGERAAVLLSRTPDEATLEVDRVGLDGSVSPLLEDPTHLDGWSFSGPSNTIRLWGTARPAPGESLVVRYDVGIVRDGP